MQTRKILLFAATVAAVYFNFVIYSSTNEFDNQSDEATPPMFSCSLCKKLNRHSLPIVYSDSMNVRLFGIEKYHVFDSEKFHNIYTILVNEFKLLNPENVVRPTEDLGVANELISSVHTSQYLDECLNNANCVAQVAELPLLSYLPAWILRSRIVNPMKIHVLATAAAAEIAMQTGFAITLGGGMHHASSTTGGGWCFFSDTIIALKHLKCSGKYPSLQKAMIIDLDAHQGNGYARDKLDGKLRCKGEEKEGVKEETMQLYILDMFNAFVYPRDEVAAKGIDKALRLRAGTGDKVYLNALKREVAKTMQEEKPDIILYIAGSDILEGDPLGGLSVSEEGLIERDELVFSAAKQLSIPIVMALGGGYQRTNARVIAKSIRNLHERLDLFTHSVHKG